MSTHLVEGIISLQDRGFSRTLQNSQGGLRSFKTGILKAVTAIGGLTVAFSQVKKGFESAINLGEVQNVVDTTFGKSSQEVNKFAKTAIEKFGLSELQAKKFSGTLGAMFKSAGVSSDELTKMSTSLVGMSGDFASFYNLDGQEAFDKIRSGIIGSTEPLQSLGINMSVANLEAYALSKGLKKQYKEMSEAEKMALRYNFIMEKGKDASGDFADTLDGSVANQLRVAGNQWDSIRAKLATMFLPALLKVTKGLNDMLKKFDKLKQKTTEFFNKIKQTQAFKDFTKNINKIKENVSELFENLKNKNAWDSIVKAKDTFLEINKTVADNLIPRFKELYDTIKPTLVNAFNELKETTDNNKGAFEKLGDFLKSSFTKAIESLSGVWSKFNNTVLKEFLYFCEQLIIPIVKGLYNEFLGLVEFFSTVLSPVFSSVMDILNEKLGGFFETAGNLIHSFTDILTGLLKFLQGTFTGDWDKAWDGIKQLFSGAWLGIQTAFEPIINGIIEKINKAIELMSKIPLLGKGLKDVKISELTPSSAYQTDQKLNFIPNSIKKNTTTNSATTNNITINGARMTDKELANAVKRGITMGAMAR